MNLVLLIGLGWLVLSVVAGFVVGRCIAFLSEEWPLDWTEDEQPVDRRGRAA